MAVPGPPLRAREHFARGFVVPRCLARNFVVAAVDAAVVGVADAVVAVVAERAFAALALAAPVDEAHIDAAAAAPIAVADDDYIDVAEWEAEERIRQVDPVSVVVPELTSFVSTMAAEAAAAVIVQRPHPHKLVDLSSEV